MTIDWLLLMTTTFVNLFMYLSTFSVDSFPIFRCFFVNDFPLVVINYIC